MIRIGDNICFLTVIEDTGLRLKKGVRVLRCRCACGAFVDRSASSLSQSIAKGYSNTSCGCIKSHQRIEVVNAKKAGDITYFTGEPCRRGHIDNIYISSRLCVSCSRENDKLSRESRMGYFIEYQKRNPEKTKAAQAKYREAHKERIISRRSELRDNPESRKKKAEYERARRQNRRAGGGSICVDDISEIKNSQRNMCAECNAGITAFHVDHIIPIKLGGSSEKGNLQILCPTCNLKKGAKDPLDWAKENGRLL
jgi:5-methylcytosine-specific restriction endonuclease McrA